MLTYFIKRAHEIRKFHVVVVQRRLRNIQKKRGARAKVLLSDFIAFFQFSLPSPSSLLKPPVVVTKKFCYHGNVTSHFSSLLSLTFYFVL